MIEKMTMALANKPQIAIASTAGSGFMSWAGLLTPYLEFAVLCIGVIVGLLTVIGLFKKNILNKECPKCKE